MVETLVQQIIGVEASLVGFEFDGELGRGGMGAVFRVRKRDGGSPRALKIVLPEFADHPTIRTFFAREMQNSLALHHAHIVESYAAGVSGNTPYLVMEYCAGGNLDGLIDRFGGRVPMNEAVRITLELLEALEYAHTAEIRDVQLMDGTIATAHGLVHRDIKPLNVFLDRNGDGASAKLGDFGLAKAYELARRSGLTRPGMVRGTLGFMPRQQLGDALQAGPEVDVWAVAATLYAMLTGETPRDFNAKAAVPRDAHGYYIVQETAPLPVRSREPDVPARLAALMDRALDDREDLAFRTASDFRRELVAVL
jgi:serine/threonine protein kinase